ncbi:MAG TPA: deoxyribose-phosphate aldolase [Candidatus Onthovivens sp.]|nr:deoxyribose-phosphate aldolase [Candidatus Onthovivens sp.]
MKYNKFIDDTVLKQDARRKDIKALCNEAIEFNLMSCCINPHYVKLAKKLLKDSDVKVCTVIGFPLGMNTTKVKVYETKDAIRNGADEIDMVINVGSLKDKKFKLIAKEIAAIKKVCGPEHILKVIIEACLLNDKEIEAVCLLAKEAGADFVKTSTGFSTGGATVHDVALMRKTVGPDLGVKASGGVRSHEQMLEMIEAGATRIGASKGGSLLEKKID